MIPTSLNLIHGKKNHSSNTIQAVIFLLGLCLPFQLSAQSILTQRIDFTTNNTPISDALIDLSEAANINIAFHPRLFANDQMISLSFTDESVEHILTQCLANTNVIFKIEEDYLILYEKPKQYYTISGYIEDAKTGERLIAATIWEANSKKGTTTNDYGFFSLKIPEGAIELHSSYLGYQVQVQTLSLDRSQKLTIALASSLTLQEVIITDSQFDAKQPHISLGKGSQLSISAIQNDLALAGESDVMRYMNTLASVQSGADGFGGLHVRGGNADQNLVLMDGVPIYNPTHTLGLFSIFNSNSIKSTHLLDEGFSAKYGGRLSSVMDVRVKEGNTKAWAGSGEIGTLASKILIEGPIKKEQTGLLLAIRRTHLDPLINQISRNRKADVGEEGEVDYHFFDLNAKLHHRLSNKDQLFLSFYTGEDVFQDVSFLEYEEPDFNFFLSNDREQQIEWGNDIAALRWNHLFNERLFANTTFTFSNYNYRSLNVDFYFETDEEVEYIDNIYSTFRSTIKDAGLNMDFEYYPSAAHQLLFGGGVLFRRFESGTLEQDIDDVDEASSLESIDEVIVESFELARFDATELNAYIEDKWTIFNDFSLTGGLRLTAFFTNQKIYISPQPRFNILWSVTPKWQLALAGSQMVQFLHILSTSGSSLPNDLWVPSTQNVRPQESWQVAVSVKRNVTDNWTWSLDGFYKKMNHLITYGEGASLPSLLEFEPDFWEEEITTGEGESYGFSTTLDRSKGRLTGQFNYAYTISNRQFLGINNNEAYPFRFNHQHEVKLNWRYQFNATTAFQFNGLLGSGQPISLFKTDTPFIPLSNIFINESELIGSINGARLPLYHRVDIGVYFKWQQPIFTHHLHLGVYNLYNRRNPYYIYFFDNESLPEETGFRHQRALPMLPSISYRLAF